MRLSSTDRVLLTTTKSTKEISQTRVGHKLTGAIRINELLGHIVAGGGLVPKKLSPSYISP